MDKKITLQELADVISAQSGATKRYTDSFLRELVVVIQEYLEKDGVVKVKGLGTFKLLWIEARKSVNVATKETIVLPAHYKLSFSPEESVKQELNAADSIVSGGATIIQDAENEVEPVESDEQVELKGVEMPVGKKEEVSEPTPVESVDSVEDEATVDAPEQTSKIQEQSIDSGKKSNKTFIAIIIVLVFVILCLAAYIMIPNIEGKLMRLFKPALKESNFEVISKPADSISVKDSVAVEVVSKPVVNEPVKDELPTQPMITVENYTPSIAKNAPTREVVTVIDGSRLTMVAYRAYGHKAFWVYVYDANRDRLKSPSAVEKGMELRIADLPKSLVNSKDKRCLDKAYELARKYDK